MKHKMTAKGHRLRLASGFGLLGEKDQIYLENLTAQLAKIHETAPETRSLSELRDETGIKNGRNEQKHT